MSTATAPIPSVAKSAASITEIQQAIDLVAGDTTRFSQRFSDIARVSASSNAALIRMLWAAKDITGPVQSMNNELSQVLTTLRSS